MHWTIRRGATYAAAALTFAAMATPVAQADVTTLYADDGGIEIDGPGDLLASVGDLTPGELAGVFGSSVQNTESLTNPVSSVGMVWDAIRCFGTTPGFEGEDNCWF